MNKSTVILKNGSKGVDVYYKNKYIGTELPYIVKHYLANFFSYKKNDVVLTQNSINNAINKIPGISEELRTNYTKVNSLMESFRKIKKLIEDGNTATINRANQYGMKKWPYNIIDIKVNGKLEFAYALEDEEFEYFEALFVSEITDDVEFDVSNTSEFIESFQLCRNRNNSFEEKILTIAAKVA